MNKIILLKTGTHTLLSFIISQHETHNIFVKAKAKIE